MMVDFALAAQRRGLNTREAIEQACLSPFRPIMMTTCAAIFGALPLAFGTGEGSELRHPLGITVVGGLIVSQILTLYTTPVVFIYLDFIRQIAGAAVEAILPAGKCRRRFLSGASSYTDSLPFTRPRAGAMIAATTQGAISVLVMMMELTGCGCGSSKASQRRPGPSGSLTPVESFVNNRRDGGDEFV